jgi:hypothetical protein
MKGQMVADRLSKAFRDMFWNVAAGPDIVGEYVAKSLSPDDHDESACSVDAFRKFVAAVERELTK